jgi:hypothetical protein
MNPTDLIFQSLSQLTGGLITDLTTVIVGMVLLAFIAMGFDLILDVLDSRVQSFAQRKKLTGRFTEPGIDNRYTTNGKLTMESRANGRSVDYHERVEDQDIGFATYPRKG